MTSNYKNLCLQVCEIARESGKIMAEERKNFDPLKVENKGLHDLVSYVDKESEIRIIKALQSLLPESGFIAEEGTSDKTGEQYNWVIDPLDGTTNYIQGVPVYCVSIALMDNNEPVLGVVYEVGQQECFYAWKGGGAYLNGQPIRVAESADMHEAFLATGFPYSNFDQIESYLLFLQWAMKNSRGVRRLGSAAADLAYVACGRFDAFWEYDLKPWDVAAGVVLVQEAGGKVFDFQGGDDYIFGKSIMASNPSIDQIILAKIKEFIV
jgi:myo-inositol-1(or 4)-monophosphatase